MFGVLPLPQRSRRVRRACDACMTLKAKCSNTISDPNKPRAASYQTCSRCQRCNRICSYKERGWKPKSPEPPQMQSHHYTWRARTAKSPPSTSFQHSPTSSSLALSPQYNANSFALFDVVNPNATANSLESDFEEFNNSIMDFEDPQRQNSPASNGLVVHSQAHQESTLTPQLSLDDNAISLNRSLLPEASTVGSNNYFQKQGSIGELTATCASDGADCFPTSKPREELEKFIDELYSVYPVIDKDCVRKRFVTSDAQSDFHFKTFLLALPMINTASCYRKEPTSAVQERLNAQIEAVEHLRAIYDFADAPVLDTVVVSFLLFCSYNVLWRHNRAFLYLGEARDLLSLVSRQWDPGTVSDKHYRRRLARLELVIFNAEAATYSIYGFGRLPKLPQVSVSESLSRLQKDLSDDPVERTLDHLLVQLTQIHLSSTNTVRSSPWELLLSFQQAQNEMRASIVDLKCLASPTDHSSDSNISCDSIRRQTADVVITDNWRSIEKLAKSLDPSTISMPTATSNRGTPEFQRLLVRMLCDKGSAALASACALSEGLLRVVGIGKLALMAVNMRNVAATICGPPELKECKNLLAGLVFTVVRADYERRFSSMLQDCLDLVTSTNLAVPSQRQLMPYDQMNTMIESEANATDHGEVCEGPDFLLEDTVSIQSSVKTYKVNSKRRSAE